MLETGGPLKSPRGFSLGLGTKSRAEGGSRLAGFLLTGVDGGSISGAAWSRSLCLFVDGGSSGPSPSLDAGVGGGFLSAEADDGGIFILPVPRGVIFGNSTGVFNRPWS